jgi:hypothetical protein
MLTDIITFEKALELEAQGRILIFDCGEDLSYHERAKEWQDNFLHLRTKARHISPQHIAEHFNARYFIELFKGCTNRETNTYEWKYLRGIENTSCTSIEKDDIEYVYALINKGYPDLVKIGMTRNTPEHRVNQINGTGIVDLWEVKFALPVKPQCGMKVEHQVHKFFQKERLHVKHQNDREMFKIDIFIAMDKIREIGSIFQAGNPIIY